MRDGACRVWLRLSAKHVVLLMLSFAPDAAQYCCTMSSCFSALASESDKSVASSAKYIPVATGSPGSWRPRFTRCPMAQQRGSMARIKSRGESGSPCFTPRDGRIGSRRLPLTLSWTSELVYMRRTNWIKRSPRPKWRNVAQRYSQLTRSYAFSKSTIVAYASSPRVVTLSWRSYIVNSGCWMWRPLIKPDWSGWTRAGMRGRSLFVSTRA